MQKDEIADILKEIGVFLELKGENPFKTRAYQNGARTLEGLAEPLDALIAEERLGSIKGIGKALAEKITELATTGRLAYYDELKASIAKSKFKNLKVFGQRLAGHILLQDHGDAVWYRNIRIRDLGKK